MQQKLSKTLLKYVHRMSCSEGQALIRNDQSGLKQDDLYVPNSFEDSSKYILIPTRNGYEKVVISNGKIVHLCSKEYAYVPNLDYFGQIENKLLEADIQTLVRSTNVNDSQFMADYILKDERYHIHIKNGMDKLRPMMTATNSYDGKIRTIGNFGFYRTMCGNGLHSSKTQFSFSQVHRGKVIELVMPKIDELILKFLNNEFYELKKKYEVLAETPIKNLSNYVEMVCEETGIFQFRTEKTNKITEKAEAVIRRIEVEAKHLKMEPNVWLGYNGFNNILYDKMNKSFTSAFTTDTNLFEHSLNYALN